MAKDLKLCVLLDYYGEMLTEKQRNIMELYYNEDLSLAEISEHCGITRQAVLDTLKKSGQCLNELETKIGFAKFAGEQREIFNKIGKLAYETEMINAEKAFVAEIKTRVREIQRITGVQ